MENCEYSVYDIKVRKINQNMYPYTNILCPNIKKIGYHFMYFYVSICRT